MDGESEGLFSRLEDRTVIGIIYLNDETTGRHTQTAPYRFSIDSAENTESTL